MNSLSWFIYLISCVSSINNILLFAQIFLVFVYIFSWIQRAGIWDRCNTPSREEKYNEEIKPNYIKKQFLILKCLIFVSIMTAIIPNKQTMIMIAASEVSQRVYESEKIKNIIDPSVELLQEWIKKELSTFKQANKT